MQVTSLATCRRSFLLGAMRARFRPGPIDKVAASIQEFGWRVPIVVDKDGVIICGHTRLLAARKLGLDGSAGPCSRQLDAGTSACLSASG